MKRILIGLLLAALSWAPSAQLRAGVSETDALIQLLMTKGLITAEEAAALRAELAVQKQEEKDKQKEFQVTAAKPVQLSGYTQVRYRNDDTINDSFDIRRARLSVKGNMGRGFDYLLQADFAGSSAKLLDASLGWKMDDRLILTAGQFKLPFSQENLAADNRMETINRSQVVEALVARGKDIIGNHNGRDIGLQAAGSFTLGKNPDFLYYALGVFNGAGVNSTDTNGNKDMVGRAVLHPFKDFSIGGSFYTGRYTLASAPANEDVRQRVGGEIAYLRGSFILKGEYIRGMDARTEKEGWYALAAYSIVPQKFQAVLKYDTYDPDNAMTKNETRVSTVGFTWLFSKWAQVQVNYDIKNETGKEISNNALTGQFQLQF